MMRGAEIRDFWAPCEPEVFHAGTRVKPFSTKAVGSIHHKRLTMGETKRIFA